MSDRVVDESNPDNYLSTKDVHSLWAEEDLLKEIPIDPWDIQGCVQKCNKLGDVVRILIKFLLSKSMVGPACLGISKVMQISLPNLNDMVF
jgi:hypothetical protein